MLLESWVSSWKRGCFESRPMVGLSRVSLRALRLCEKFCYLPWRSGAKGGRFGGNFRRRQFVVSRQDAKPAKSTIVQMENATTFDPTVCGREALCYTAGAVHTAGGGGHRAAARNWPTAGSADSTHRLN